MWKASIRTAVQAIISPLSGLFCCGSCPFPFIVLPSYEADLYDAPLCFPIYVHLGEKTDAL